MIRQPAMPFWEPPARGVYEAPYLVKGCPALLAIDSQGNCVRRVRLVEGAD